MRKQKVRFDYGALRPLDMVVCAGRSPFAAITRLVSAGRRRILDHSVSVHTGILVDFHGQLLIAEMTAKGLQINSLEKYNTVGSRRWVIAVRRNKRFKDAGITDGVQKQIAKDRRRTLEYDWKGLIEFVTFKVKDNPQRNYCSEYVYELTRSAGIVYPDKFKRRVSPYDLQVIQNWNNVPFVLKD